MDRRLPLSALLGGVEPQGVQEPASAPGPASAGDARQAVEQLVAVLLQIPVIREMLLEALAQRGVLPGRSTMTGMGSMADNGPDAPPPAGPVRPGSFAAKLAELRARRNLPE